MAAPLANLTPEMLRHAHAVLVDSPLPAIEVEFLVDGVHIHITARDLDFIHALDASRFGSHAECPICKVEVAA